MTNHLKNNLSITSGKKCIMVLKMFLKKINYNFFFNQDIHLTTKYKNLRIIDVSAFIRYPKVYIQC